MKLSRTARIPSQFPGSKDLPFFAYDLTKTSRLKFVHTSTELQSPAARIVELETQLRAAEERANVAEEQLRRVHVAVRAFKKKQLEARAAQLKAQVASATPVDDRTNLYSSWAVSDPSLDDRLDQYLSSDFEPDRSRDWMLRQ